MSKSLVDMIEELGADVAAGLVDADTATQQLQEFSNGGLTHYGAADLLKKWKTARATYAAIGKQAREDLRVIAGTLDGGEGTAREQ